MNLKFTLFALVLIVLSITSSAQSERAKENQREGFEIMNFDSRKFKGYEVINEVSVKGKGKISVEEFLRMESFEGLKLKRDDRKTQVYVLGSTGKVLVISPISPKKVKMGGNDAK